tara:strand:+ start:178 stop:318 length:141 start_codon:yes stop_codon:yes gene_type:complete
MVVQDHLVEIWKKLQEVEVELRLHIQDLVMEIKMVVLEEHFQSLLV